MGNAVIIGNGQFPKKDYPLYLARTAERVVCCDGALSSWLRFCKKTGIQRQPDAVIGDLDSLSPKLREEYSDIIVHVEEQDDNDQTKALRYILEHFPEVDEIHILGATGKREDHTIGNLSLLMEYTRMFDLSCKQIDIVSDYCTAFPLNDTTTLHIGEGRRISIFSPDNTLTIKSKGLVWPTDEVKWDNWWKGTLNRSCEDSVTLSFSHPSLALVILD